MSWANFVPNLVTFLYFFHFYSVFLIILFGVESFLDIVSKFPCEEMATLLPIEQ
jgi:hypothetical protein